MGKQLDGVAAPRQLEKLSGACVHPENCILQAGIVGDRRALRGCQRETWVWGSTSLGPLNSIWHSQYGFYSFFAALLLLVLWSSGFFDRLFRIIEEMMFNNWQLALLGADRDRALARLRLHHL